MKMNDRDIASIKKSMPEFIKMCGQSAAQVLCFQGTVPRGKKQEQGKRYKVGEGAVRAGVSTAIPTIQSVYEQLVKKNKPDADRFVALLLQKRGNRAKRRQEAEKIANKHGFRLTIGSFSANLHTSKRNRRGRVEKLGNTLVLDSRRVEAYKKRTAKEVGRAKSGWVAPEASWFKRRPAWIKRHGSNGTFKATNRKVKLKNNIKYAKQTLLKGAERKAYEYGQAMAWKAWQKMHRKARKK